MARLVPGVLVHAPPARRHRRVRERVRAGSTDAPRRGGGRGRGRGRGVAQVIDIAVRRLQIVGRPGAAVVSAGLADSERRHHRDHALARLDPGSGRHESNQRQMGRPCSTGIPNRMWDKRELPLRFARRWKLASWLTHGHKAAGTAFTYNVPPPHPGILTPREGPVAIQKAVTWHITILDLRLIIARGQRRGGGGGEHFTKNENAAR